MKKKKKELLRIIKKLRQQLSEPHFCEVKIIDALVRVSFDGMVIHEMRAPSHKGIRFAVNYPASQITHIAEDSKKHWYDFQLLINEEDTYLSSTDGK